MKYTSKDYRLYVAFGFYSNAMVLESRVSVRHIAFAYGLDDEEIVNVTATFNSGELDETRFAEDASWKEEDFRHEFSSGYWESDEYVSKVEWYAVLMDKDDNDWGTGSYCKETAFDMAEEMGAKYVVTIINGECVDIEDMDD